MFKRRQTIIGKFKRRCVPGVIIGVLFLQSFLLADEQEEQVLRSVLGQYQEAVLTVKYVLKIDSSFGGQMGIPEEQKGETPGTVIDPSGLLVISNSQLKGPSEFFEMMDTPGKGGKFDFNVVPMEFKVVMPDDSEVPARLIAQDSDLDLAFLMLEGKNKLELKSIQFTKGYAPKTGEILVVIGRLNESLNHEPMAYNTQIVAMIRKPRRMFLIAGLGNLGCPVFNLEGKAVGIMLMRPFSGKRDPMTFMTSSGTSYMELMPMVLPAEEIMEAIKRLPASSPLEEKKSK